ncbi:MAG: hypothetical protein A3G33_01560 [Omnitrophica bacterium RIFCSPLOWO2_12_FULL_44_17]|uniref:SAM-dependent MTase RsmB/NOP-type domain-containing protein n=1 Tax=Candidatus Danuiimicrobium aquiferis TaxID=1801832 RepID=A0A1G1KV81_9BACT|nr:MAG: hypothetical protein A3B72_00790 [Omnitrophica bacterium RIFCSPHIGHO2_02_FULL_45_28]OGW96801.1 MAG: hypothetical protein A3G33_01560 [Omnitrophica bacterium RIFCSPLOWO2_12_FULL_44_17]OGX03802.1 MAG: hypothetical protein A3J12_09445 [Omnitrophica bacterium RIFCSPLOWO2_02_FULL_44_11]
MRDEIKRLPAEFLERLRQLVPSHKFDSIVNTFAVTKPTTFRVNTLKATAETVEKELRGLGFRCDRAPWLSGAFILREGRLRELQETEIYKTGKIYVQNLSSMIPVLVLDPQPGETILDLTAAPGSKTTQIACLMKNDGRLVANDNNKIRFFRLKANIELQGCKNVELMLKYGEAFGRIFPETFDRVLLDAPCSAEGRFDANDPRSIGYWKIQKVKEMAHKQKKLIFSGIQALKPGGILVYSTCTFAPEENEEVLDFALKKNEGQIELESIKLPLTNQMPGIRSWQDKKFHPSISKSVRILPANQMEGFFVARLRKS